jgi:hypothetical protein
VCILSVSLALSLAVSSALKPAYFHSPCAPRRGYSLRDGPHFSITA